MNVHQHLPPDFPYSSAQLLTYLKGATVRDICNRYNSLVGGYQSTRPVVTQVRDNLLAAIKILESKKIVYAYIDNRSNTLYGLDEHMPAQSENEMQNSTNTTAEHIDPVIIDDDNLSDNDLLSIASIHVKYGSLIRSAVQRDLDFDLDIEDVKALLSVDTCYYSGVAFVRGNDQLCRTIDRVNSTRGYVKGNVVAATLKANAMKNRLFEQTNSLFADIHEMKRFVDLVYIGSVESQDPLNELLINKL